MPREGLCRILLVLCIAEKGTNQEVAYQRDGQLSCIFEVSFHQC